MRNGKILIADDEPSIAMAIKSTLIAEGHSVETAENGRECVQKALKFRPDVIILDIMMPVMDGPTAAQELKNQPQTADIPIIFLTALVKKSEERKSESFVGDTVFLAKPFDSKILLEMIDNF